MDDVTTIYMYSIVGAYKEAVPLASGNGGTVRITYISYIYIYTYTTKRSWKLSLLALGKFAR